MNITKEKKQKLVTQYALDVVSSVGALVNIINSFDIETPHREQLNAFYRQTETLMATLCDSVHESHKISPECNFWATQWGE